MSEQFLAGNLLYPEGVLSPEVLRRAELMGLTCVPLSPGAELNVGLPGAPVVCLFDSVFAAEHGDDLLHLLGQQGLPGAVQTIVLLDRGQEASASGLDRTPFATLPAGTTGDSLLQILRRATEHAAIQIRSRQLEKELDQQKRQLHELNRIGVALSAERSLDKLLDLILEKTREITVSDAGSLYLIEGPEEGDKVLRFKLSHNDSLQTSYQEFTMPLSKGSIAGYVGLSGESLTLDDVYYLPPNAEFSFNPTFDRATGYRTKSMLVVAMKNNQGDILGVIQLINRKRHADVKLTGPSVVDEEVLTFDERCEELVSSLASQAAVALENSILYEEIEQLFEGFVRASVTAIESRDPTTRGHSERVAIYTVGLAEVVDRVSEGPYADTRFSRDQLKELRYASLLHDFGKVGVREHVLVKAKKLYDHHIKLVQDRFEFAKRTLENEYSRRKVEHLLSKSREEAREQFAQIDSEFEEELRVLDEYFQVILLANEPTVLEDESFERLVEVAGQTYTDLYGASQKLLQPDEARILSIRRGSLDENERKEIESHSLHTFWFLEKIPWTKDLRNVPVIAVAHHEKLNGKGYPHGLAADRIPLQARMMTISDVYDALTAADRPYKKAVPKDRALDILKNEAKNGMLDPDLLGLFIDAKVYDQAGDWKKG